MNNQDAPSFFGENRSLLSDYYLEVQVREKLAEVEEKIEKTGWLIDQLVHEGIK